MRKHNGTPFDSTINKKEAGTMKPLAALSGVEFYALASKGFVENVSMNMKTGQSLDDFNKAAEKLSEAYRGMYREIKKISVGHELAEIEARKEALLA